MNFIIAEAVVMLGNFLVGVLVLRALMSWFPLNRTGFSGKLYVILTTLTDPIVAPCRRLIQRSAIGGPGMVIDISPMLAFIAIHIITTFIANILRTM